jgi:hypothetical protein
LILGVDGMATSVSGKSDEGKRKLVKLHPQKLSKRIFKPPRPAKPERLSEICPETIGTILKGSRATILALEQLEVLSKLASSWFGLSYGDLRLNPDWDLLRGDPRFEKLVEEVKKPVAMK